MYTPKSFWQRLVGKICAIPFAFTYLLFNVGDPSVFNHIWFQTPHFSVSTFGTCDPHSYWSQSQFLWSNVNMYIQKLCEYGFVCLNIGYPISWLIRIVRQTSSIAGKPPFSRHQHISQYYHGNNKKQYIFVHAFHICIYIVYMCMFMCIYIYSFFAASHVISVV